MRTTRKSRETVIATSGGPDSIYLVYRERGRGTPLALAHFNHGARGRASEEDQKFVEGVGRELGIPVETGRAAARKTKHVRGTKDRESPVPAGFEAKARKERYAFLNDVMKRRGTDKVLLAHTADDQVETVLMRLLEGAGISGLKGIPRKTEVGIERPMLDTWREEVLRYLHRHKIPYRVDRSNLDTRFERNWVRHVLVPMIEKRYGKSVKRRIFALGERFREIDAFLEDQARRWMKRHVKEASEMGQQRAYARVFERADKKAESKAAEGQATGEKGEDRRLIVPRKLYSTRPSLLRKKIVQLLCYERVGIAPNERLLEAMDGLIRDAGPSAKLNIGSGAVLRCEYEQAIFERARKQATSRRVMPQLVQEEGKAISSIRVRAITKAEHAAVFATDKLLMPATVRPLKAGDRIVPFGMEVEKKVKEILIDRKVPREERWGRPVVCDATGRILWIPGVVRSAHAPVTSTTRRTILLRMKEGSSTV